MGLSLYRDLLAVPRVGPLYLAAFLARIPMMALPLVLTLLVVQGLDRSYAEAGIVAAAETVGAAVGSPWRGRMLDRMGLRRAMLPSIVAVLIIYPVISFAPYVWLIPLAFLAGVFLVPIYSIVRLALTVMVPEHQRRTAFAFDSVMAEAGFIIGPALGGALVVLVSPHAAVLTVGLCVVAAASLFWWFDPPTRPEADPDADTDGTAVTWLTTDVLFLFLISGGAMAALMSTDLGIVAGLRELDSIGLIGLVYLGWGGSSLIGGLVYGARPQSIRPSFLLLALGLLTIPVGFAHTPWVLALATLPAGFLCAPVLTSTNEWLMKLVPAQRRGVASGWMGTAFTVGGAVAAPLIGWTIDHGGASAGFAVGGSVGVVIAVFALGGQRSLREPTPAANPS